MKVLIISPGCLPIPASKGGAVEKLIEAYINYNEINHIADFTLYTVSDSTDYNKIYKYTKFKYINNNHIIYKISKILRYIINNKIPKIHIGNAFIAKVAKQLKKEKEKYDVIIVENTPFNVLKLRKIYPNTKIIYHIHNDYLNNKTKRAKKILDNYDNIIAISEFIKNRIQTIYNTNKIQVIYNGIPIEKFSQQPSNSMIQTYKQKYNISSGDIVFIYTGRIVPEKGVKELVSAFCNVLSATKKTNLKLLIVGSKASIDSKKDMYRYEVEKIANEHKKNIIFTGFIPNNDIPIMYYISNVQVIPSNWGEPLGNVVIEGMASGIKQIVTNDGGIPEIAQYSNSIIVDKEKLTENLYKAIKDCTEQKKYSRKEIDKKILNNFSEETYSKEIFNIIKDGMMEKNKHEN